MTQLPHQIEQLCMKMRKLPGVGPKASLRYVLAMAQWDHEMLEQLANSVQELKDLAKCNSCGMYVHQHGHICDICSHPQRSSEGVLCLVENVVDLMAMERSGQFHGVYHILNGLLNPLLGNSLDSLNLDALFARLTLNDTNPPIHTLIMALPPSVEGDITSSYIRDHIHSSIKVERLGVGIPMGGHLDYLDPLTISKAIENRRMV